MRVDLSTPFEPIRKKIEHESFGSCVLLMKPLGIEEMAAVDAAEMQTYFETSDKSRALESRYVARAKQCLVGWEGIEDGEGKPIPYSWPAMVRIGLIYPKFAELVAENVSVMVHGVTEDQAKNSDTPLPTTSVAAATITQS